MFDIVIDYPDSTPALHDLKVGLIERVGSYHSFPDVSGNVGMLAACRSTWPTCTVVA